MFFLSIFMCNGTLYEGTLLDRLIKVGLSPVKVAFSPPKQMCLKYGTSTANGLVDSLKFLLCHDNFVKPWSEEHFIATLLTKAF